MQPASANSSKSGTHCKSSSRPPTRRSMAAIAKSWPRRCRNSNRSWEFCARVWKFSRRARFLTRPTNWRCSSSPADLAAADPHAGKKPLRELPPGSAILVAEADRYFSTKQFDKAEDRYLQVLRKDERNVPTLANLAAIQLEMNHR